MLPMHQWWYDPYGNPVSVQEAERLLGDIDARRIAETKVGEQWVSTVCLVLDHGMMHGPPMIFETVIFPDRDYCERTSTREAALAAHDRAVAHAKHHRGPAVPSKWTLRRLPSSP